MLLAGGKHEARKSTAPIPSVNGVTAPQIKGVACHHPSASSVSKHKAWYMSRRGKGGCIAGAGRGKEGTGMQAGLDGVSGGLVGGSKAGWHSWGARLTADPCLSPLLHLCSGGHHIQ